MRSEEEQAELLREWWEKNGRVLIVAIVVSVVGLLGWRQWSATQDARAESASTVYSALSRALEQTGAGEDQSAMAAVREHADRLLEEYPRTTYAAQARLALARLAVMDEDYEEAASQLRAVVDRSPTRAIEQMARLRLARVLLQQGDADGALALVRHDYPEAWRGQALEIRGDALRAQDRRDDARAAYSAALEAMASGEPIRDRVQMKLDDMTPAS
ncbi:YfgM family protein [Isoalcanivorax indicus]|uniref:YfgM family protein n=1 Tax=Isoalcanivorax indicus TaxID=2202653 RepID=UPI0013C4C803|nr:tetratricopeptide repeat protein [Isoalcanivorax indicus]